MTATWDAAIQTGIALLSVTAVALSQSKHASYRRWACIFGLLSQPFWFVASYQSQQWGVFVLSFLYTACWLKGLWDQWLFPAPTSVEGTACSK